MKIVKRTPDISTTDLVGRMLLCTKQHHLRPLDDELRSLQASGDERLKARATDMEERIQTYALDASGLKAGVRICFYTAKNENDSSETSTANTKPGTFVSWDSSDDSASIAKKADQRFVYVDGSFDLFSSGHIEFLRRVAEVERIAAEEDGWNQPSRRRARVETSGKDYDRAFVIVGIHNDHTVNQFKGSNYPIMNIYERGLCVLQCRYIDAVVFGAPYDVERPYLEGIPINGAVEIVYHGKTNFFGTEYDGYGYPRQQGFLKEVPEHEFQSVNAAQIYRRIIENKDRFEERQRKKGVKAVDEAEARRIEVAAEAASKKG